MQLVNEIPVPEFSRKRNPGKKNLCYEKLSILLSILGALFLLILPLVSCSSLSPARPDINNSDSERKQPSLQAEPPVKNEPVRELYSLPNGGVVSVGESGGVRLWKDASHPSRFLGTIGPNFTALAFDSPSQLLAASFVNKVSVFSLSPFSERFTLTVLKTKVSSLDFHPDGESLLLGGADSRIYRWPFRGPIVRSFDKLERYIGHSTVVSALRFHPYGKVFFSGDWAGNVHTWSLYEINPLSKRLKEGVFEGRYFTDKVLRVKGTIGTHAEVSFLLISPDGERLVIGTGEGNLQVWRVRGFQKEVEVMAHTGVFYSLDFDGKRVVSAGRDGSIKLWEIQRDGKTELQQREMFTPPVPVKEVRFVGNGHIVGADSNGKVISLF